PHVIRGLRAGLHLGDVRVEDLLLVALLDSVSGLMMAGTADVLAKERGITREEADLYALRSQQAADAACRAGRFSGEIVPVEVKEKKGPRTVSEDDHRRPDTTLETLRKLPPAFGTDLVTAGNASGIVDGAAAVVVASEEAARRAGLKPLGRVAGWAF